MTKKQLLLAAIPMLLWGMSSCSHDDVPDMLPAPDGQEIRVATRSTTDSESSTTETFTRDFYLDLWSSNIPSGHERHAMSHDGTSWNVVKTSYLDDTTVAAGVAGTATYIVFTDDGYDIMVPTSQTDGSVDDYDMMFAYNKEVNSDTPLSLHFEHLFVKLTFNIVEYGNELGDTPTFATVVIKLQSYLNTQVKISGVQDGNPEKTYSQPSKTVSTSIKYGDTANHTDDKIEAIVGYGTLPAETEFLYLFKEDDYDFEHPLIVKTPASGLTFEKGKHYTFNLKVGKDKVTLTQVTASEDLPKWSNDDEEDLN